MPAYTLFDTAALYGFGANETLVGQVLKRTAAEFTLASKCGMAGVQSTTGKRVIDGRPETPSARPARTACAACRPM